jgi:hypothetical protein
MLRRSETEAKHALRSLGEAGRFQPAAITASHGAASLLFRRYDLQIV